MSRCNMQRVRSYPCCKILKNTPGVCVCGGGGEEGVKVANRGFCVKLQAQPFIATVLQAFNVAAKKSVLGF